MKRIENVLNSKQFKQALFDVQTAECEQYAALPEAQEFSPGFERKMERLLREQQKPHSRYSGGKKAVLALAAAFILLVSLVFGVSAIREPIMRFFVETYGWFFTVVLNQPESETAPPNSLETIYLPSYLPEGYVLEDEEFSRVTDWYTIYIFVSPEGDLIIFQQYLLPTPRINITAQGVPLEEIMVGEYPGLYGLDVGSPTILWQTEEYGFSIAGSVAQADVVDKEVLLKMACSLKEK